MSKANGIEYLVRGRGEPVLLIHGGFIARSFAPVMKQPALAHCRLICMHRRGYLGSDRLTGPCSIEDQARDALAVLQDAGVRKAHVVGWSFGGPVALQLGLDAPQVVHSLFLIEPALYAHLNRSWRDAFADVFRRLTDRYLSGDVQGATDRFMQGPGGPDWAQRLDAILPGGSEEAFRDGAAAAFEAELPALDRWEFDEAIAGRITQPVAYVTGSESSPLQEPAKAIFSSWVAQSEGIIIQGADHQMAYLAPEKVANAVAEFVAKHPIAEATGEDR